MAISQVGFGLKPINKLGSNYNAAQVTEYRSFTNSYRMGFQTPVTINIGGVDAPPRVFPQYSVNQRIDGSFVGVQFDDADTGKPVFTDHYGASTLPEASLQSKGNFNAMVTQFVTDDPYQLYLIKTDENMTVSAINGNYSPNVRAGLTTALSSDGKRSIVKLDSSTKSFNSNRPLQFMYIGNGEDDVQTSATYGGAIAPNGLSGFLDAGSNVVVRLNNNKYAGPSNP